MAADEPRAPERSVDAVRADIHAERERLAHAVTELKASLAEATDIAGKLRARLPAVAGAALGAGFFLAGGIGATMRLLARRGREVTERARVGRYTIVERD